MDYLNYKNAFKVYRLPLKPIEYQGTMIDMREQLLEATCAMLILQGYAPYEPRPGKPHLSAYYVASNRVYQIAVRLAEELGKQHKAVRAKVPLKHLMDQNNIGRRGINTLIGTEGLGTMFCAQVVLTDMFEAQEYNACDRGCVECGRCIQACPNGAITKEGLIKERCVRYHLSKQPISDDIKELFPSLLGCDLCQQACPRNVKIAPYAMPEELDHIFTYANIITRSTHLKDQFTAAIGSNLRPQVRPQTLIMAGREGVAGFEAYANKLLNTAEGDAARYYLQSLKKKGTAE